jgi:hypothetical protein
MMMIMWMMWTMWTMWKTGKYNTGNYNLSTPTHEAIFVENFFAILQVLSQNSVHNKLSDGFSFCRRNAKTKTKLVQETRHNV